METFGERLKACRKDKGWTQAVAAKKAGMSQPALSELERDEYPTSSFTPQLASVYGVNALWLANGRGPKYQNDTADTEYVGPAPGESRIAVAAVAQLGTNGWYEEMASPGAEGYVDAVSSDADAYVLQVKGDSMHPAIRNGWYVVVEPNRQSCAGEYAAIRLKDGRKMVKEFLYRTADAVVVESVNGGERMTLQLVDVDEVHPIGAVLMPSKHRDF